MALEPPPTISETDWATTPPAVQTLVRDLIDLVRALSVEVQELRSRVNQTSRNSSQPPSSDPPSMPPRSTRRPSGRHQGAQPGHPDQQRPLLSPDQVHERILLQPSICPHCAAALPPDLPNALPPVRTQVWEILPITPQVTEYQQRTVWCHRCRHLVHATLPPEVPPGVFGPRLTALMALLHGRYQLSTRETQAFLTEVAGVAVSLGCIIRSCARVSAAIAPLDQAIHDQIQRQPVLHMDETSWREGHQRGWLWVVVSPVATCFRIDPRRNRQVVRQLIGHEYRGIVHSDRAPAYSGLPDQQRQLCWSHLLRTLQGLVDHGHAESWWARQMLAQGRHLVTAWHAYRCGLFDRVAVQQALLPVRHALHDLLAQGATSPWRKLRRVARDLQRHWDALWWFSRIEGVEPTNNAAERALRPAVLWRKRCFGTQSTVGSRFVERMLSVGATCRQQARNVFAVLTEAVAAAWSGQPVPTLFATP